MIDDVVLAIQEAMTNAVRHSGVGDEIEVTLFFNGMDLMVLVRDHGRGFDVAAFDPGEVPDLERTGGRGLYLISRLMDGLELRSDHGLEVRCVKRRVLHEAHPEGGPLPSPTARAHRVARNELLLEEIDEGFFALDWEYRYQHVNTAYERLTGRGRESLLGHSMWDVFPALPRNEANIALREAMELGRPSIVEYVSPLVSRWMELRVYPATSGVTGYLRDIDGRKRKELERDEMQRRSALLARTSARLLSTDDPQGIIEDLCRDVMNHIGCDVSTNYLVDGSGNQLLLNAYAGLDAQATQAIAALEFGAAVSGRAAREVRRIVVEDVRHSDDRSVALVRALGVQVYAAHPLVARGRVLGTLSFGARDRTSFAPEELDLMETIAGHVAIAVDRQRGDRALRDSEERFRVALQGSPIVVFSQDRDLRYTWIYNPAPGFRTESIVGKTDHDICTPEDADAFTAIKRQVLETGVGRRDEVVTHRPAAAGGDLVHDMATEPILDDAGVVVGVMCAATDITHHKQTEEALHRADDRAEELVRTAATAIYEIDFTVPRFRSVNDSMCLTLGFTRDELLAMNPMDLLEPGSRAHFQERVRLARAGLRPVKEAEYQVRTRDGRVLDVALSVSYASSAGGVDGALVVAHDVTERKRTERALRESEALFRSVFENTIMGVALADAGGRLIMANQAFLDLLGYEPAELTQLTVSEITYADDRAEEDPLIAEIVAGVRSSYRLRKRYVRKDGSLVWVSLHTAVVRGPDGTPLFGVGVAHDVSDQKQAADALRASEERFRLALRNAPVSVATQDLDLRYTWAYNQRSIRPSELIGKTDADVFTAEEAERLIAIKRRVITEDIRLSERMWFDRPTGPMYLHVFWEPLHDDAGNVVGVGNATVDLTQMKLAKDALSESEERFRAFFNSPAIGAVQVGLDGQLLEVNDRYCEMTGFTRSELLDMSPADLAPPQDHERDRDQLMTFLKEGRGSLDVEKCYVRKDGREIWVHVWAALVHDADGHPARSAAVIQDVTTRRCAEQALQGLYESQRDLSLTLQRTFQHALPDLPQLDVGLVEAPSSTPELVGGDLWDLIDLGGGHVLALVGDVSGSGIAAASLTWTVRAAIQALAEVATDPAYILEKVSEMLLRRDEEGFVTALAVVLDTSTGELMLASAGHPAPVLLTASAATIVDPVYGPPLGSFTAHYVARTALLQPDNYLVLYTDGLTEARRGSCLFGEGRVLEGLRELYGRPAQEVADGIRTAAESFAGRLSDDLEVMVLRLRARGEPAAE